MSSLTTLARPYAKAAFDLANSQGELGGWNTALDAAADAVSDEKVATWLHSPDLERQRAVELIGSAVDGSDERFSRFLGVLADNDRLPLLPQVAELFGKLREEAENQLKVRVVSAVALSEDQATRMSEALARRFDCEIDLQNEVDATVLGGAVIYAGDEVIDGSLRGRLNKLESSLG